MPATVAAAKTIVSLDAARFHDSVDQLIADDSLSRQQKIQALMRWQHEARIREMRGRKSGKAQLTLILQALHKLEANEFV